MGVLTFENIQWIDIRGNNYPGATYGIVVANDGDSLLANNIYISGNGVDQISNNVKISYIESHNIGKASGAGNGLSVQETRMNENYTFDSFEIHNNYIHDVRYAAMYLGGNFTGTPRRPTYPLLRNFSIHHNYMEDLGAYCITFKGIDGGINNRIYANSCIDTGKAGDTNLLIARQGIGSHYLTNSAVVNIYNNLIKDTSGVGIKLEVEILEFMVTYL
jgi:hypothetical protein